MLSFPRVLSSTPVFYFKLAAGISVRVAGGVIVSERERDSFKSWGQECSSASQGHWYFMAFTFLHDKLMPRIDWVARGRGGVGGDYRAFKPHLNISSLLLAHLHLTLLSLCGQPQGHAVWSSLSPAKTEGSMWLKCRHLFGISSVTHLCFMKSFAGQRHYYFFPLCVLLRDADSRGSLNAPSPALLPAPQTRFLSCHRFQSTLALKLRTAELFRLASIQQMDHVCQWKGIS